MHVCARWYYSTYLGRVLVVIFCTKHPSFQFVITSCLGIIFCSDLSWSLHYNQSKKVLIKN